MDRRNFIQKSGITLGAGVLLESLNAMMGFNMSALASSAFKPLSMGHNDKILVIIQLHGGNDGLNMVIPLDAYDNLANLRNNILIPQNRILKLTDELGLHPVLGGISELFNEEALCIIQNVGYKEQNRSHFRSLDIWNTASNSDEFLRTGWIGRFLEKFHASYPHNYPNDLFPDPLAIHLGNTVTETCQGSVSNFSFALDKPEKLALLNEHSLEGLTTPPNYLKEINFIESNVYQSNLYSKTILKAFENGNNKVEYNEKNLLAQQLKIVSKLISGGLNTKFYVLSLGGFDTHANQTEKDDTCNGDHAIRLQMVSDAIKSFQEDLIGLGIDRRVLGITTSEFGRQIRSNDSYGTDHGEAAPLFVFGTSLKTQMIGKNPIIPKDVEEQASVKMQIDFRDVYATILKDWFGMEDLKDIFQRESTLLKIV